MAIDTATRRFSMMNMGGSGLVMLPPPDGAVDATDRAFGMDIYSGIELEQTHIPVIAEERHHYWMERQGKRRIGMVSGRR